MTEALLAILMAAKAEMVQPSILAPVCHWESGGKEEIVLRPKTGDGVGMCQVRLSTARWLGYRGTKKGLLDPKINASYAAQYLRMQLDKYETTQEALAAYNAGTVNRKGGVIRNIRYVRNVLSFRPRYLWLDSYQVK